MPGAVVGEGCNICDHVFIEGGARLGDRVIVKNRCLIWDGVEIGDDVLVGPAVVFTNDRYPRNRNLAEVRDRYSKAGNWRLSTRVERGATIGAGSVILPGLTIGEFAVIAAGAVVTHDVAAHELVVGHPARGVGWACRCGARLALDRSCETCGVVYEVGRFQRTVRPKRVLPGCAS
jgi:acetyltransferase-like isoleucine patch superfamily enzyme